MIICLECGSIAEKMAFWPRNNVAALDLLGKYLDDA